MKKVAHITSSVYRDDTTPRFPQKHPFKSCFFFFSSVHYTHGGREVLSLRRRGGDWKILPFPPFPPLVFTLDSIAGGGGGGGKKILGKMKRELIWEMRFLPVYIRPILAHFWSKMLHSTTYYNSFKRLFLHFFFPLIPVYHFEEAKHCCLPYKNRAMLVRSLLLLCFLLSFFTTFEAPPSSPLIVVASCPENYPQEGAKAAFPARSFTT